MVWREPSNHATDCYFCVVPPVCGGITKKKKWTIVYLNIPSADEMYQRDATIVIYYHKYLYTFRAPVCPSSGVQVVCYYIWCSALGVVVVVLRSRCVALCTVQLKGTDRIEGMGIKIG
jgi:hypothetical protein